MTKETEDFVDEQAEKSCLTINKASLAEAIWEEHGIDRRDGKVFVDRFFELIIEELKKGSVVKLPGLGNFTVRDKNARPGRNLKTGDVVMINERRVVNFHPSGTLQGRVTENLVKKMK